MKWPFVRRWKYEQMQMHVWTLANQRMDGTKLVDNAIGLLDPFRGPVDKRALLGPDWPPPASARSIRELAAQDCAARRCCHCVRTCAYCGRCEA
jgi:hypothetical protein